MPLRPERGVIPTALATGMETSDTIERAMQDIVAFAAASGDRYAGLVGFVIDGEEWNVRLGQNAALSKGRSATDCTVELSSNVLADLRSGLKNPQAAFMAGEIQVRGDIQLVLRFWELFEVLFSSATS